MHVSMMMKPDEPPTPQLMFLFIFAQVPYFIAPDPRSLPSIPENVRLNGA